jgi:hypothetical protein
MRLIALKKLDGGRRAGKPFTATKAEAHVLVTLGFAKYPSPPKRKAHTESEPDTAPCASSD